MPHVREMGEIQTFTCINFSAHFISSVVAAVALKTIYFPIHAVSIYGNLFNFFFVSQIENGGISGTPFMAQCPHSGTGIPDTRCSIDGASLWAGVTSGDWLIDMETGVMF